LIPGFQLLTQFQLAEFEAWASRILGLLHALIYILPERMRKLGQIYKTPGRDI